MEKLKIEIDEDELNILFRIFDLNENGKITFSEFSKIILPDNEQVRVQIQKKILKFSNEIDDESLKRNKTPLKSNISNPQKQLQTPPNQLKNEENDSPLRENNKFEKKFNSRKSPMKGILIKKIICLLLVYFILNSLF